MLGFAFKNSKNYSEALMDRSEADYNQYNRRNGRIPVISKGL
jgi:hypothetical protein